MSFTDPRNSAVGTLYQATTLMNASTSGVVIASGYGSLLGYEVCTQTLAASFRLHDGASVTGASQPLGAQVIVPASTSMFRWYGPQGLPVASCIGLEVISGGPEITIYGL